MTLFVTARTRRYEISDIYVMALVFILFYLVGKITRNVIKKQMEYRKINEANKHKIKGINPRGGQAMDIDVSIEDTNLLSEIILSCIEDEGRYRIISAKLKKLLFKMVKEELRGQAFVLTPNMLRFLALTLKSDDHTLQAKIGSLILSSDNQVRFVARAFGTAVIAFVGGLFVSASYAILLAIIYFDATQNCNYRCEDYFEKLPQDQIGTVYVENSKDTLVLIGNDPAKQIEVYVPSKEISDNGPVKNSDTIKRTYRRSKKRFKQVNFSEFRKTDPVLSSFSDLEEPFVPQKTCPVERIQEIAQDVIDYTIQ